MMSASESHFALHAMSRGDATVVSSSTDSKGSPPSRNPHFQRLVEGILFSRRFILSYQLVLLGLLLGITFQHWGCRIQSWRRRRRRRRSEVAIEQGVDTDTSNAASSSSSTLQGSSIPSPPTEDLKLEGERIPLLPPRRITSTESPRPSLHHTIKAFLAYQPFTIPVIHRPLPSNATTVAVLLLWAVQMFYTFYRTPLSVPLLFVFADRTSLLFVANLPLLYLLAAKNQPIKLLTGYSYEALNIFHRRLGEIMCLLALLHSVGMLGVWYTLLRPTGFGLVRFLFSKIILLGLGAFIAYELIYFTSLGSFRERWYELFLGLHIMLQVVALVFLWFHHQNSRPYIGVALGIFLVDRILFRILVKRSRLLATLETTEDRRTVILHTTIPRRPPRFSNIFWSAGNIYQGWKSTHHVFLSVPALAPKHIIQAHPFTIASEAPSPESNETKREDLRLIIRAQDGFSKDLVQYSKSHARVAIQIDGPYGSQTAVNLLKDSDISIIVAGGSGIAVTYPLVCSLLRPNNPEEEDLDSFLPSSVQQQRRRRILFIWVVKSTSHLSWLSPGTLQSLQKQGVDVIIPPATIRAGRPDLETIIEMWLLQIMKPQNGRERGTQDRIGVVCSGPDGMNRDVRNWGAASIMRGFDLDVEVEKFGW